MKKVMLMILVAMLLLTACSEEISTNQSSSQPSTDVVEQVEPEPVLSEQELQIRGLYDEYYPVYIVISYDKNFLFNKDVELNLYIDGEKVTKLAQGDKQIYGMILPVGEHKLKIASSLFNSDSLKFTVGPDPHMGKIFSYFLAEVQFKMGEAEISEFMGNTMGDVSADEAVSTYNAMISALYTTSLVAIGDFEIITDQYECRQFNTARAVRHVSSDTDEWEWLDGTISFQLPVETTAEYITVDELKDTARDVAGVRLKHQDYSGTLTTKILPADYGTDSLQIFDVLSEIDVEELFAEGPSDGEQKFENIIIKAVFFDDVQVYETHYTVVDADGSREGVNYMLLVNSILYTADFRSSDIRLLSAIGKSTCIGGTYSQWDYSTYEEQMTETELGDSNTNSNLGAENTSQSDSEQDQQGGNETGNASENTEPERQPDSYPVDYDAVGRELTGTWKNSVWYIYLTYLGNNLYDIFICGYPGNVETFPSWHLEASYNEDLAALGSVRGVYYETADDYVSEPTEIGAGMFFYLEDDTLVWPDGVVHEYKKTSEDSFYGNLKVHYGVDPSTWDVPSELEDDSNFTDENAYARNSYIGSWEELGSCTWEILITDLGDGCYEIDVFDEEILVDGVYQCTAYVMTATWDAQTGKLSPGLIDLYQGFYNEQTASWEWQGTLVDIYDPTEIWFDSENQLHIKADFCSERIFVPFGSQGVG